MWLSEKQKLVAISNVAVPAPGAPIIADQYRDLFNDTLPDNRHVPEADALRYVHTDCEITVSLEIMNYEREVVLDRLSLIDGKEVPTNPLDWWKRKESQYPILSSLARRILCVPATSAPCERLFSYAGLTISNDRNRLLPENAEEFIVLRTAWSKIDAMSAKRKREVT